MSEMTIGVAVVCWFVAGACGSGMMLLHFRKRYDPTEQWGSIHSLMTVLGVINFIAVLIVLNLNRRPTTPARNTSQIGEG